MENPNDTVDSDISKPINTMGIVSVPLYNYSTGEITWGKSTGFGGAVFVDDQKVIDEYGTPILEDNDSLEA